MKTRSLFLCLVCLELLLSNALAADFAKSLSLYEQYFHNKPAGTYQRDQWVFFIADQPCLSQKRYAGTSESQKAAATAMRLMADFLLSEKKAIHRSDIAIADKLGDDMWMWYQRSLKDSTSITAPGQRIVDRNWGQCSRRVVYALAAASLKQTTTVAIAPPKMEALKAQVFAHALQQKEYKTLSDYFNTLGIPELAVAFAVLATQTQDDACLIGDKQSACLATQAQTQVFKDLLTAADQAFHGGHIDFANTGLSYINELAATMGDFFSVVADADFEHVIQSAYQRKGLIIFAVVQMPIESHAEISTLNNQADSLFKQGINAPEIVRLYSRSLNIQPQQPAIWAALGAIMKAFDHHGAAYAFFTQALLQEPTNTDYWLQIADVLSMINQQARATALVQQSKQLSSVFPLSDWGKQKIENIRLQRKD